MLQRQSAPEKTPNWDSINTKIFEEEGVRFGEGEEKLSGEGDTPLLLPKTAGPDCAYLLIFKGFRLILNPCSWKREMNLPCGWLGKGGLGGGQGSCLLRKRY